MTTFLNRVTGAALLNPAIYEEVEADRTATAQAMAVVALSSLAAGVGAQGLASVRITALAGIGLLAFAVWAMWAVLTLQIGARSFLHRAAGDIGSCSHDRLRDGARHPSDRRHHSRHGDGRVRRHGDLDAHGDDCRHQAGARLHEHRAGVWRMRTWMGALSRLRARYRNVLLATAALKGISQWPAHGNRLRVTQTRLPRS